MSPRPCAAGAFDAYIRAVLLEQCKEGWVDPRSSRRALLAGISSSTDLSQLVEPTLMALDFELVRVRLSGGSGRPTLQIMAEPVDRSRTMTVHDCATISRAVSAVLDVADPIAGEYCLEVSSPGLDRPLVTAEHFHRFVGEHARLETEVPVEGRKRFVGVLTACDGKTVTIKTDAADYVVPLASVRSAKLVLEAAKQAPARPARTR